MALAAISGLKIGGTGWGRGFDLSRIGDIRYPYPPKSRTSFAACSRLA
jgi:hypothetical protein